MSNFTRTKAKVDVDVEPALWDVRHDSLDGADADPHLARG
jgi:hypothetical protein